MNDKLIYKEFIGIVHYSTKDSVFFGKIEGINDLVTFEGESVADLKSSFKGSFNVLVIPKLHSKAFKLATLEGNSLNQLVSGAIEEKATSL